MTIRFLLATTMALAAGGLSGPVVAADTAAPALAPRAAGFATTPRAAWQADDPADSLYRAAREALNRGDYRAAARTFAQISEKYPTSAYAADALYWEAYAHYSVGEPGELRAALRALDAQKSRFPKAATRGDADALAVRVRGALARAGDSDAAQSVAETATRGQPCGRGSGDERDDERMVALNALLQMNAEQAMPVLKQVLARRDACSASLREKALFLVSQKQSPETESILLDAIRNDPDARVRKRAVFWLGQVNTDRATRELESILGSASADEELRENAIMALMQQSGGRGAKTVRAVAEDASAPASLRAKAVFWLGQNQSAENATFLRDLFSRLATSRSEKDDEVAQRILFSLSQMRGAGNERWLMDIAADPKYSVEVRRKAVFSAGQGDVSAAELIALYDKVREQDVKAQVIWVLSMKDQPAATDKLIDIARHDPDVQMRKKAIFWLGQSNDPRVKQLLLDIINGR
jgi:TolA-binding protein